MTAVSVFHLLEFFVTAIWNPTMADADSFLVNHSISYTAAFFTSFAEFWIRWTIFPNWNWRILSWMGVLLVLSSQAIRSLAMITAGESFSHIIQTRKKESHLLITHGIYSVFRHPSYVGFFYWSISLQLVLGNILNTLAFALASWTFFNRRIPYEEESLSQLFPNEYPSYVARTWMGIPFITSSILFPPPATKSPSTGKPTTMDIKRD